MSHERERSRRGWLRVCGGVGLGGIAGCLRLAEGGSDGSDPGANGGETDPNGGSDGADGTPEERDFDVELVPTWERDVLFRVVTADGDFFTGHSEVTRVRPDGGVVFETEPFADDHATLIRSGWRNALYVDGSGCFVGTRPDGDDEGARMHAFDSETGTRRWTFEEPADGLHDNVRATTRTEDLVVYASMSSGSGSDQEPIVRALDATTGDERWEIGYEEGFIPGIFPYDGRLLVQRTFGLSVHDLETRELIEELSVGAGFNRAALDDGTLYLPGDTVRALSLPSGEERWSVDTGREINTSPTLDDAALFVGTEAGFLLAFDRETGESLWENRVGGVIGQPPVVDGDLVWVASERGDLSAFTRRTGDLRYEVAVEPGFTFAVSDGILLDSERGTAFEIRTT